MTFLQAVLSLGGCSGPQASESPCADVDLDTAGCGTTQLVFGASLVDAEGANLHGVVDPATEVNVLAVAENPDSEPETWSSPDCLIKSWDLCDSDEWCMGTTADCFDHEEEVIAGGGSVTRLLEGTTAGSLEIGRAHV